MRGAHRRHERVRVRESSNRIYAAHKRQVVFHLSSDAIPVGYVPGIYDYHDAHARPLQPYIRMRRNNSERHLCAAMRSAMADGHTRAHKMLRMGFYHLKWWRDAARGSADC